MNRYFIGTFLVSAVFIFASCYSATIMFARLDRQAGRIEIALPEKNDKLSMKIMTRYLEAYLEKYGQPPHSTSLATFIALPNVDCEIKENTHDYVVLETTVWGQKDTFDNTKAVMLANEKKLISGKIVHAVDTFLTTAGNRFRELTNQLPQYDHKSVALVIDDYTVAFPRVLYDTNRGWLMCETRMPKAVFNELVEKIKKEKNGYQ